MIDRAYKFPGQCVKDREKVFDKRVLRLFRELVKRGCLSECNKETFVSKIKSLVKGCHLRDSIDVQVRGDDWEIYRIKRSR